MMHNFWTVEVIGPESSTPDFTLGPYSELEAKQVQARLKDRYASIEDMEVKVYRMQSESDVHAHFDPWNEE